jgi:uncharacterized membrane protein YfcA
MAGEPRVRRAPALALAAGAAVGGLGGLIGLGGAEFRLPILVGVFGYALRRAVRLNLTISLVTVVSAAATRLALGGHLVTAVLPVAAAMAVGGIAGARAGSRWLARMSDRRLEFAVRTLLLGIGVLLIVESALPWEPTGLPLGAVGRGALAVLAGVVIGVVSSLLGVAGGELIIPTLLFAFGVEVKTAGTASLLISIPTIVAGLWRPRGSAEPRPERDAMALVVPMGVGSIAGALLGGILVTSVSGAVVKPLLGVILIVSALGVFRAAGDRAA